MTRSHGYRPARWRAALAAAVALAALGGAGCGGATNSVKPVNPNAPEVSPAGDIPDNQAYIAYAPPGAGFSVKVPEGWARTASGGAVTFTDKLNAIRMERGAAGEPATAAAVKTTELARLARSVKGFSGARVSTVRRTAGPAVRITYVASAKPDPVTGKVRKDAVERYVFAHNGRTVVLTLSGPVGADNVDPWKLVTESLRFTR